MIWVEGISFILSSEWLQDLCGLRFIETGPSSLEETRCHFYAGNFFTLIFRISNASRTVLDNPSTNLSKSNADALPNF